MKLTFASLSFLSLVLADPTIYLIRHGEKPSNGNGLGTQGMQRAQCLRNVFGASSGYSSTIFSPSSTSQTAPGNVLTTLSTRWLKTWASRSIRPATEMIQAA
ncbi:hypothetical protein TI39_contig1021g00006 [Zymoseptoria brevis]|uniref:Phosphoglycerate mutase family protein n=1 Tax=Zymoseptoria brevis TaxID=1047168 RepID=A0A0F4GEG4_9PEZI|nr:hypothetical protein TI39_contig1021g00006 [Zymoseptoria brevis]